MDMADENKSNSVFSGLLGSLGNGILNTIGGWFGAKTSADMQYKNQAKLMALQHKYNNYEMQNSMGLQQAQQQNLMKSMYNNQVSGMASAGLNPAMAQGSSPVVPSSPSPTTGSAGPSSGMPAMTNPLDGFVGNSIAFSSALEDLKSKEYDNRLKQIDVENKEAEDDENNTVRYYLDPETGKRLTDEEAEKYAETHPGKNADFVTVKLPKGSKGRRDAQMDKANFERMLEGYKTDIDDAQTKRVCNKLQRAISLGQLNRSDVLKALVDLPLHTRNKIQKEVEKISKDKELVDKMIEYQDKVNKDFDSKSIAMVIEHLKDPNLSGFEKFMVALTFIFNKGADALSLGR